MNKFLTFLAVVALGVSISPVWAEEPADGDVLARVNGEVITYDDFDYQLAETKKNSQSLPDKMLHKVVLEQLIENKLVLQAARKQKLEDSDVYQQKLAAAKERVLQEMFLEQQAGEHLSDSKLKKLYRDFKDAYKNEYEVRARHILVKERDEAEEILEKLAEGADFIDMAEAHSLDRNSVDGGDLGYFPKGVMVPEFEYAAFSLPVGDYTKTPVQTRFGWHIIKVEERRQAKLPSFEKLRPQLTAHATRQILQDAVDELRDDADIEVYGKP